MIALPVVDRERRPNTTAIRDLDWYDYCLVSFSGGKDSVALALGLLKKGVARGGIGHDDPGMPCGRITEVQRRSARLLGS